MHMLMQVKTLVERLSHEGRREKQLRRALKQALDYMTPIMLAGGNADKYKGRAGEGADTYVLNKLKKQLLTDLEEPLFEKGRLGRACARLLKDKEAEAADEAHEAGDGDEAEDGAGGRVCGPRHATPGGMAWHGVRRVMGW
jgi:hypothetical protein